MVALEYRDDSTEPEFRDVSHDSLVRVSSEAVVGILSNEPMSIGVFGFRTGTAEM